MQRSIDVGVIGAVRPAEWLVRGGTIVEREGFEKVTKITMHIHLGNMRIKASRHPTDTAVLLPQTKQGYPQ